jgi:hypothetical protein
MNNQNMTLLQTNLIFSRVRLRESDSCNMLRIDNNNIFEKEHPQRFDGGHNDGILTSSMPKKILFFNTFEKQYFKQK